MRTLPGLRRGPRCPTLDPCSLVFSTANGNAITGVTASATGTASFFRIRNNAGTAIWQGTCGTFAGAAGLVLTTLSITSGDTVNITDIEIRISETLTTYTPS